MASRCNWATRDGLLGMDDPAEVDAAFERGERHVGTAVIGLVLNCGDLAVAAPRVERALRSEDMATRQYGFTAAGHAARLCHGLTPAIYDTLHAEGPGGMAEDAISDALTYVPFREMPGWLKWIRVTSSIRRFFARRWIHAIEGVASACGALRNLLARLAGKRRSGGSRLSWYELQTGDGLLGIDDPAEVGAAFERGRAVRRHSGYRAGPELRRSRGGGTAGRAGPRCGSSARRSGRRPRASWRLARCVGTMADELRAPVEAS